MPTFLVFKNGREVSRLLGANAKGLDDAVRKLAQEADSISSSGDASSSSASGTWLGASLPRNYVDITDQVDVRGLDLLNVDSATGDARTLFDGSRPSGVAGSGKGKGKSKGESEGVGTVDWLESDTDEQVMLFVPFQATLKVHSLHFTSAPPAKADDADEDDETPMRPRTIRIFINRSNNLSFDEAEDEPFTQEIVIQPEDWDASTATAKLELRFVKFQKVSSLVIFVVDGEGEGEKVRLDRLRVIGEMGEKRTMGKLEKVGDLEGE